MTKQKKKTPPHLDFKMLLKKSKGAVDVVTDKNRTLITMNPDYKLPPTYNHHILEAKAKMFRTVYEKEQQKGINYDLTENARTKLELCAYEYDIPFETLEEIFLEGVETTDDEDGGYEAVAEYIEEGCEDTDKLGDILLYEGQVLKFQKPQHVVQTGGSDEEDEPARKVHVFKVGIIHNHQTGDTATHTVTAYNKEEAVELAKEAHKQTGLKNYGINSVKFSRGGLKKKTVSIAVKYDRKGNIRPQSTVDDVPLLQVRNTTRNKKRTKLGKKIRKVKLFINDITEPVSSKPGYERTGATGKSGEPGLNKGKKRRKKETVALPQIAANDNKEMQAANDD